MMRAERGDKQGARLVERGQICFGLFIAVCVALHPGFVLKWNEGGMSDYGSHIETALPYTLALLGLVEFSRRAASLYRESDRTTRRLRRVLYFYSAIVLVMLVSTYVYTLNFTLRDFHFGFGTILILFEVSSSVWMFLLFRRLVWDGIFLIMQVVGECSLLGHHRGGAPRSLLRRDVDRCGVCWPDYPHQSLRQLGGGQFLSRESAWFARRDFIRPSRPSNVGE